MTKVYKNQQYLVQYDTNSPVELRVVVEHFNQTLLTKNEIIEESNGYLEDMGIKADFDYLDISIKVLAMEELKEDEPYKN
jgi:hypothetical protein